MLVHFKSKLSKVIGEEGPVGSGVGVGVGVGVRIGVGVGAGVGIGVGVGVAIGEGEGAGAAFTTTFFCHRSLPPTFLQISDPEAEFSFMHLAPTFGVAA